MQFEDYLIQHLKKHPSAQPQDMVKMCYQAAFGAEHLLADIGAAKKYFYSEYDSVSVKKEEFYEDLSADICRINLSAWKASGMPAEWLFQMFADSAGVTHGSEELFLHYLKIAENVQREAETTFSQDDWENYLKVYKVSGIHAVHHSDVYRQNEKPSYRIVSRKFLEVLPVLQKASSLTEKSCIKVIAIDGRAASGKSTMAKLLKTVLGADRIHMDDFFLPSALRVEKRLDEPGGNIHYERFLQEVLPVIKKREGFSYRIFDCSKMAFYGERKIEEGIWRIVEGSYSHHPKFGKYADFKVFLDVDADKQRTRIIARNGEDIAEMFQQRWIPMEEKYFAAYQIKEKADLVIVT